MLKVEKGIPVPHSKQKGKRNAIWEEAVRALVDAELNDSVYVSRSLVNIASPKNMAVPIFRYFSEVGGRGWYTAAVEGDGVRIWKIGEPKRPE